MTTAWTITRPAGVERKAALDAGSWTAGVEISADLLPNGHTSRSWGVENVVSRHPGTCSISGGTSWQTNHSRPFAHDAHRVADQGEQSCYMPPWSSWSRSSHRMGLRIPLSKTKRRRSCTPTGQIWNGSGRSVDFPLPLLSMRSSTTRKRSLPRTTSAAMSWSGGATSFGLRVGRGVGCYGAAVCRSAPSSGRHKRFTC